MKEWESASQRVDYQLSFRRSREQRVFGEGELNGEDIDCARTNGNKSLAGWYDRPVPGLIDQMSEEDWVNWYQMMALQECVHEALEWFNVDGEPWLDPHIRDNKIAIRAAVIKLWRELKKVRSEGHTYG